MNRYYCATCWKNNDVFNVTMPTSGLQPTGGKQLAWFKKHVCHTSGRYPDQSVFTQTTWPPYQESIFTGINSGALQVESNGRKTLYYLTEQPNGTRYVSGQAPVLTYGTAVVCAEHSGHAHAFPKTFAVDTERCAGCGGPVSPRFSG